MKRPTESGPITAAARITSLDLIRGVAVLGILLMNAVSFRFATVPYLNLSAGGSETWLDWAVGLFGEIFVDQKFMGLFSLLFGAGVVLFLGRVEARGGRAALLSLWRNGLLLAIGILHSLLWSGDVLTTYALSSVVLIVLRKLPAQALVIIGTGLFLVPVAVDSVMQSVVNATDSSLVGIWVQPGAESVGEELTQELLELLVASNYFLRGLALILMGAGLYRWGFVSGEMSAGTYRKVAIIGLGVGLPLAAAGVIITVMNDFSRDVAFSSQIPNHLGTIPASLGYMSLLILWNRGSDGWLKRRLRAAGRMALTNYLTQTILGVLVLTAWLGDAEVNRSGIVLFVVTVWALQLWWSQAWLGRFLFGPMEWLWRVATYRSGQPLRRPADLRRTA
jgi:uncharacterized protein